jgi:hypothetical protein
MIYHSGIDSSKTNLVLGTNGSVALPGDVTVGGTLTGSVVSSNATGTLTTSNLTVNGSAAIAGTLTQSGTANLTGRSTVSNALSKFYGTNVEVVTGGTVTFPAASLASTALPAAIANSTLVSNALLKVQGTNVTIVSGGSLTVGTGGTVTLPASSVEPTYIKGGTTVVISITGTNYTFTNGVLMNFAP